MELHFERELSIETTPDELRSRLLQWASANGFTVTSDLRNSWAFTRGSQLNGLLTTDVRKVPTSTVVQLDPTAKIVRASMIVKAPLSISTGGDSKRMEAEVEALVASIRGTPAPVPAFAPPTAPLDQLHSRVGVRPASGEVRKSGATLAIVGALFAFVLLGGVVLGLMALAAPQFFRVRGVQTPVNVTMREGFFTANVLRVQNLSQSHIPNVVVSADRPSTGETEARRIESLAPGEILELGGLEWDWVVHDGDTVTVKADGYLPIVFTSNQISGQ
jgi:hypothetical protein